MHLPIVPLEQEIFVGIFSINWAETIFAIIEAIDSKSRKGITNFPEVGTGFLESLYQPLLFDFGSLKLFL